MQGKNYLTLVRVEAFPRCTTITDFSAGKPFENEYRKKGFTFSLQNDAIIQFVGIFVSQVEQWAPYHRIQSDVGYNQSEIHKISESREVEEGGAYWGRNEHAVISGCPDPTKQSVSLHFPRPGAARD